MKRRREPQAELNLRPADPPVAAAAPPEASARNRLLQSFLRCTHGDLTQYAALHREARDRDPIFYNHLARWYMEKGVVRDHQELFVASLLVSPFPVHRENAHVLMQRLRVYQVARVVKLMKERLRCCPRSLRSAVTSYLRRREAHRAWFDECAIRNRRDLKLLYASLHIRPDEHAEKVLFAEQPPAGTRVAAARQLGRLAQHPDRQAEIILRDRIHFTTAIGAVRHYTPAVVHALVSVMSPQQVINNLQFLEKRGALAHPPTRALIDRCIARGAAHARVNDLKTRVALQKVQADARLATDLLNVTHERLRGRGRIDVPTALLVDKSGSMDQCIELGRLLASLCSTLADSDLHVYAFDDVAFKVAAADRSYAAWEKAFAMIRADGCTSVGAGLMPLLYDRVEQILLISDGEENSAPYFHDVLAQYEELHGFSPRVVWLHVASGAGTSFEASMRGRDLTDIPFDGDYYSLPNIIPMLTSGGTYALLQEVLSTQPYTRADLGSLPPGFDEATLEIL